MFKYVSILILRMWGVAGMLVICMHLLLFINS